MEGEEIFQIDELVKGLPDDLEEVIATRFVDYKVSSIIATTGRRRVTATSTRAAAADAIANNLNPALVNVSKIEEVSGYFPKISTNRCGGAKGPDTPR